MMTPGAEIREILAALLATSRQMLPLAQAENWDALVEQEEARRKLISRLQQGIALFPDGKLPAAQTEARALIREILNLDAKTQALTEQRLVDLREGFQDTGNARRLHNAYGRL